MRIEAVTVSVDYSDFLAETLPFLLRQVDDLVVVTSPDDQRTRDVCAATSARVVATTAMYDDGRTFSVGAAINEGLKHLRRDDWILAIDADIVLGGILLRDLDLFEPKLYGIDRFHAGGYEAWRQFCGASRHLSKVAVPTPQTMPMGYRIAHPELGGYAPCGFFQLWNPAATGFHDYPVDPGGTAEGSDMLHAARWPRVGRELIPEVFGIELLSSPRLIVGENWRGARARDSRPSPTLTTGVHARRTQTPFPHAARDRHEQRGPA